MDLKHIGVLVSKLLDLKVIELVSSSCGHLPLLLAADHCTVKEERLLKMKTKLKEKVGLKVKFKEWSATESGQGRKAPEN